MSWPRATASRCVLWQPPGGTDESTGHRDELTPRIRIPTLNWTNVVTGIDGGCDAAQPLAGLLGPERRHRALGVGVVVARPAGPAASRLLAEEGLAE